MKILLVLCDGMRPDAIEGHKAVAYLKENGTYCMDAQTVMPSVTLPCHMSLFHSTDPARHGITTNMYVPQVRPVSGLFEQLKLSGKKCAMFYSWEELRDIARPDNIALSEYISQHICGLEKAVRTSYNNAKTKLKNSDIDFAFLYLGWSDEAGHDAGWMSNEYMHAVSESCNMLGGLIEELSDEYAIIFTADHGGHDRMHGTELPEDMTIPIFFLGEPFKRGKEMKNLNIKDIAPTIASLLGAEIPKEWEGRSII